VWLPRLAAHVPIREIVRARAGKTPMASESEKNRPEDSWENRNRRTKKVAYQPKCWTSEAVSEGSS
jgi:hypothetical protein